MIDYFSFEGVNGNVFSVDQIMDFPLSNFDMTVETRNDEQNKVQRDGNWQTYDYLGQRTFHFEGDLLGSSYSNYWKRRAALLSCFEPRPDLGFRYTVRLHIKFTGIDEELIADCNLDGQPELALDASTPAVSNCMINLKAADPRLYGANIQIGVTGFPVVSGGFTFAMTFPLSFTVGSPGGSYTVINSGNVKTYPTVLIYGPCISPTVTRYDVTGTPHNFILNNLFIQDGDYVTIDMRDRSVVTSGGYDASGSIDPTSEWLYLEPGLNQTKFVALNPAGSCRAEWHWQNAYLL